MTFISIFCKNCHCIHILDVCSGETRGSRTTCFFYNFLFSKKCDSGSNDSRTQNNRFFLFIVGQFCSLRNCSFLIVRQLFIFLGMKLLSKSICGKSKSSSVVVHVYRAKGSVVYSSVVSKFHVVSRDLNQVVVSV